MKTARDWVTALSLIKHPEGGHYSEGYRSELEMPGNTNQGQFPDNRSLLTSIYFLLERNEVSAFHRIKSDELWYFHQGSNLKIHTINAKGEYQLKLLGSDIKAGASLFHVVKAGDWFASEIAPDGEYGLVSCAVSPGFDFRDFELADQKLASEFPQHAALINRLLV